MSSNLCSCGTTIRSTSLSRHRRTKKHYTQLCLLDNTIEQTHPTHELYLDYIKRNRHGIQYYLCACGSCNIRIGSNLNNRRRRHRKTKKHRAYLRSLPLPQSISNNPIECFVCKTCIESYITCSKCNIRICDTCSTNSEFHTCPSCDHNIFIISHE